MQMSLQVENRNKVSYKLAKTHNGNENGIHRQVCVTLSSDIRHCMDSASKDQLV